MYKSSFITLDFESGGLSPRKNPVTQVALQSYKIGTFEKISEFESYVQPYANLVLEDAAMKYTGITHMQLNSGITVKEMVQKLCEEFTKANYNNERNKKPILLGHNIMFDIGFLCYAFDYCKVDISKYLDCKEDHKGTMIPVYVDTMTFSRLKWGNDEKMSNYKLQTCCEKGKVSLMDAHSAMNDVQATSDLFIQFINNLRTGENSSLESEEAGSFRKGFKFQF